MFEVAGDIAALLIAAALFAGFVDSIAGGGGLITLPVLMLSGASPIQAIATNKVQAVFGSATATVSYARAGQVDLRRQIGTALIAFAGGLIGALLASRVPAEGLRYALPVILIAIAAFFAFKRGLNDEDRTERLSPVAYSAFVVPLIGFYDGAIGPGAGSFYMLGFVMLAGYGVLKATAHTKLLNFGSNLGGLVAYAAVATPWWKIGLAMGLAQMLGAQLGSRMAMKRGARLIKPLLVATSLALAARLIWQLL
uniref:TSUP family transporter n=1 Tax=Paenirhodobacter enshiensis TaxID=1105367 RepID=UPI0035AE44DB